MPGLAVAPMSIRLLFSPLLCVSLIFPPLAMSPLPASAASLATSSLRSSEPSVALLGLEGSDEVAAQKVTEALRTALESRKMAAGEALTLGEVRLMMGCEDDAPACLKRAGDSMGVDKVVFGFLSPEASGGFRLELHVIDVAEGIEESQATHPLAPEVLEGDALGKTADEVVRGLFPVGAKPEEPPPPPPPQPVSDDQNKGGREGDLVWGSYQPRPAWKWAGLGTGLVLTVGGLATFIGTGIVLQGPLRDDLLESAEASLDDDNDANDVDPNDPAVSDDLCAAARAEPEDEPGHVTNASMTSICNRADQLEIANIAGIGIAAAGLVTTIVFTTLLFVHRRDAKKTARLERFRFAAGPRDRGFHLTARIEF